MTVGTIAINVDTSGSTTGTKLYDASAAAAADQKGILASKRDATTGALAVAGTFDIATLDISTLTDSAADLTKLDGYIKGADAAISEMTSAASNLGAEKSRISTQQSFVSNLMQAIDKGVGSLVDADMNEEFDETAGAAGAVAARHPVAVDRQPGGPVDHEAVPVI